ncbi:MAG: acyl carrier protein [Holophaga sp.]|nr:acyl carrier protein [Holophaga sp.]
MKRTEFIQMMADLLEAEPGAIQPGASLFDFPFYDSVCALMLMVRLEEDARVACSPADLAGLTTIGDVEALVARQVGID